ncbi:General L-amino acid transport system permease protein AapQ [Pararhodospirillum photometricum DSM 122]|uniref:General L-amino acid transport system permease protein AapQ n=1 Tax=Pararhodospirillum photometricum DSM 122 TaxID=1150469 RepID=H6SQ48_PARPM|nr:General L-amino acid transport system permease protein AapQ [Pararhodospirillum photometricum DSM 122]
MPRPLRRWLQDKADVVALPGDVILLSPEALTAVWALAVFTAVYLAEEIRAGLGAVPAGQREAAQSQGLGSWQALCLVLLPQALANARQPVIGQYLNLMKLSSFASAIGLAEITYQVRQIESFNAHALEAFAVGTALYLGLGLILARVLDHGRPRWQGAEARRHGL